MGKLNKYAVVQQSHVKRDSMGVRDTKGNFQSGFRSSESFQ